MVKKDYTLKEILNQAKALKAAYNDIIGKDAGADLLKKPYDELILNVPLICANLSSQPTPPEYSILFSAQ